MSFGQDHEVVPVCGLCCLIWFLIGLFMGAILSIVAGCL